MSPLDRAWESLEGLSAGDAFGQCFFSLPAEEEADILQGEGLPEAPWYYTDDTEMSLSVLAVLSRHGGIEQDELATRFARHYSYDRAYGPAMHRALMRIRDGEPWREVSSSLFSGQGSFGNGAPMRAAPIGAYFADDHAGLVLHAARSAEVTHSHPEAIAGAIAVAAAAGIAVNFRQAGEAPTHAGFLDKVIAMVPDSEVRQRLMKAKAMEQVSSIRFPASVLGDGTEMSAQDTVPFALWCCAQSPGDFEKAVWLGIQGGVDRDTMGAIIGGVVVCCTGRAGIPGEWLRRREDIAMTMD